MASLALPGFRSGKSSPCCISRISLTMSFSHLARTGMVHRSALVTLGKVPRVHSFTALISPSLSASRKVHTSTAVAKPHTPTSSINTADSSPSTTTPLTAMAMQGSNQLSLETPKNGAGEYFGSSKWRGSDSLRWLGCSAWWLEKHSGAHIASLNRLRWRR
jgi:hypothetical protein